MSSCLCKAMNLTCSVGFWCDASQLSKLFTQMAVAVKPTPQGNLHNRLLGLFQQLLCSFNPLLEKVLVGTRADRLLKHMAEMKLTHAQ